MSSDPLAEARRERDLILDRVTWWDTHRYSAIFPIAIGFFAAGGARMTSSKSAFASS